MEVFLHVSQRGEVRGRSKGHGVRFGIVFFPFLLVDELGFEACENGLFNELADVCRRECADISNKVTSFTAVDRLEGAWNAPVVKRGAVKRQADRGQSRSDRKPGVRCENEVGPSQGQGRPMDATRARVGHSGANIPGRHDHVGINDLVWWLPRAESHKDNRRHKPELHRQKHTQTQHQRTNNHRHY